MYALGRLFHPKCPLEDSRYALYKIKPFLGNYTLKIPMCGLRFVWHFLKAPLTSCVWLLSSPSVVSSASGRLWAGGDDGRCGSPGGGAEISLSASCCSLRRFFLWQSSVKNETCQDLISCYFTNQHIQNVCF